MCAAYRADAELAAASVRVVTEAWCGVTASRTVKDACPYGGVGRYLHIQQKRKAFVWHTPHYA